ncbi:response regulator transcription factor [Sphingomonas astaxanthinifaciens]|uniref:HTH luxR-type domain-containing protein n=1 Tax=Sphingomonas astaxanthinifaciens DSM 22298 TaxID=1123267 RepID=A0ABQ5Z886_9SPHN|nr:helix-turn-helix domain-containing protein [Sphingomonas astaxanthinifaciens]GLR48152.1 hypothetical protein GCM10007925_18650 [Sphingomonas astaxanthinifaciens DSM 22298]
MPNAVGAKSGSLLTDRQTECLRLFWSRKSAKEIGQELGISHHAVEKHLQACRERLGVQTSVEAARMVFGGSVNATVRPYYDASELHADLPSLHLSVTPSAHERDWGGTDEKGLINRFGPVSILLLILGVGIGAILAVAVIIEAAQGIDQLGSVLFN